MGFGQSMIRESVKLDLDLNGVTIDRVDGTQNLSDLISEEKIFYNIPGGGQEVLDNFFKNAAEFK